jgi:hypothetical protein
MAVTQYIGARYVPLFADPIEWDDERAYEPLTIVVHRGNSYTSRQSVPIGIDISEEEFWALTGNYDAQVEQYRNEVQTFNNRITANTNANAAQDEQLAGTTESGLKTLITTNAADIDALEAQTAGTTESGLKTLITTNAADIDALEAQTGATSPSGLLTLIQDNKAAIDDLASKPSTIWAEGARPILRYEVPIGENIQGGTYFEQNGTPYYAVARIVSGQVATKVDIFNLSTQQLVSTCTGTFAHGNSLSYDSGHLYVGGADDSTTITEIDVTSISTPYVSRSFDLAAIGEVKVWAFGVYDDDHFWYTPNNNAIYLCTRDINDKTLLCYAVNPDYMAAVQQGMSYDRETDTFISCKSSYFVMFNSTGLMTGGYRLNWQYGYVFTAEVEQATMVNGKVYFNNNATIGLPAGFTDYKRVNAVFEWDISHPIFTEPFVMPLGARQIYIDADQPKIPNFDRVAPDRWHYPLDAAAYMLAHPEGGRGVTVATDTPFVLIIPPTVNSVSLGNKGVGGVALMNGADVYLTGNVAYSSSTPETAMLTTTLDGRKLLCSGRGNMFTFFGTSPTDESVWIYNMYGGASVATSGKLEFVRGTGAKIAL